MKKKMLTDKPYGDCVHEAVVDLEACSLSVMLHEEDFSGFSVDEVAHIGENAMQNTVDKVTAVKTAAQQAYFRETDPEKKAALKKYLDTLSKHHEVVMNEDHIDNVEDKIKIIKNEISKLEKEKGEKEDEKEDVDKEIPVIIHTIEELTDKIKKLKDHMAALMANRDKGSNNKNDKNKELAKLGDELTKIANQLPLLLKELNIAKSRLAYLISRRPKLDPTYKLTEEESAFVKKYLLRKEPEIIICRPPPPMPRIPELKIEKIELDGADPRTWGPSSRPVKKLEKFIALPQAALQELNSVSIDDMFSADDLFL